MITFSCPSCSQSLQTPEHAVGQRVACPRCKGELLVPGPPTPTSHAEDPPRPQTAPESLLKLLADLPYDASLLGPLLETYPVALYFRVERGFLLVGSIVLALLALILLPRRLDLNKPAALAVYIAVPMGLLLIAIFLYRECVRLWKEKVLLFRDGFVHKSARDTTVLRYDAVAHVSRIKTNYRRNGLPAGYRIKMTIYARDGRQVVIDPPLNEQEMISLRIDEEVARAKGKHH